jgi:hypothetical protein
MELMICKAPQKLGSGWIFIISHVLAEGRGIKRQESKLELFLPLWQNV